MADAKAQASNSDQATRKIVVFALMAGMFAIIASLMVLGTVFPEKAALPEWIIGLLGSAIGIWGLELRGALHFLNGSSSGSKSKD